MNLEDARVGVMKLLSAPWQNRYWADRGAEVAVVLIICGIVYVLRNQWPSTIGGWLKWLVFLALGAVEWLLYYVAFLSAKYNFFRWRQTLRLVGFPSSATRKTMRRFAAMREHRYGANWPEALVIAITLFSVFYLTRIGLFFALFLVITQDYILERFRRIVPPAVLLLTTSERDTLVLHARISWIVRRLRAVALLKMEHSYTDLVSTIARMDCFRTASDDVWEEVVEQFIRIAPILVLDSRRVTPAVVREAERIMSSGYEFKLILLVGGSGQRPLIDHIAASRSLVPFQGVPVVREAGLLTMLHYLTRSRSRLPSPCCPLQTIIQDSAEWRIIDRDQWAAL